MKKNVGSLIIGLTIAALISIIIAFGAILQFTGSGILSKKNNEMKIETIILTDITDIKAKINPEASIQSNNGIMLEFGDSNKSVNIIEIDVDKLNAKKHLGRIFFSSNGSFEIANSVIVEIREGKNFVLLNENDFEALYFDLPISEITLKSITLNPSYSILELIQYGMPMIIINFCVLVLSFMITLKRPFIKIIKVPYGVWAVSIVMLYYYDKFLLIMGNTLRSYVQGLLLLLIIISMIKFLEMILKKDEGAAHDN